MRLDVHGMVCVYEHICVGVHVERKGGSLHKHLFLRFQTKRYAPELNSFSLGVDGCGLEILISTRLRVELFFLP